MSAGKLIKESRLRNNLTLEDISNKIGIKPSMMSRIESDQRSVQKYSKLLSKVLDITEDEIETQRIADEIIKKYGKHTCILDSIKIASSAIEKQEIKKRKK